MKPPQKLCKLCESGLDLRFPAHSSDQHLFVDRGQGYEWHVVLSRPLEDPETERISAVRGYSDTLEAFIGLLPADVRVIGSQKGSLPSG